MTWKTRPRSRIGELAAIVSGEGRQIVLLHGVGLRAEAWGAQIDELSRSMRVVAFDLPGHGESPQIGSAQLSDYCDMIAHAIEYPSIVVGHSFGAMIALHMAALHPEKVKGVAALNAIYRRSDKAAKAVLARAASLNGSDNPSPKPTLERWFGSEQGAVRDACEAWLASVDPKGYRDAYGVFARGDAPADTLLQQIACPALFLTGSEEPNSTPAMTKALASLVPRGKPVVIRGAAHMLPMTHPGEANDALHNMIDECR
ncbi:MAG: alpha/beta hydrolase [Nitratireductor sp.]|nr:alpha/beta hydrolase [Nitratireductor sp.]